VSLGLALQGIRISTPYVYAALGGVISERGGVANLALEGVLLLSAFAFVAATAAVGGGRAGPPAALLVGLAASAATGAAIGAVMALTAVACRANHILCGLAVNLLAAGLSPFLLQVLYHSASNSPEIVVYHAPQWLQAKAPAPWSDLFHPLTVGALALTAGTAWMLGRTRFGLHLRAAGENLEAARAAGVRIARTRAAGVIVGCMAASLGGAWLAMSQARYSDQMSAGRGYMAIAAMIVGKWTPWGAAAAALCFGLIEAAQIRLQNAGLRGVPRSWIEMSPYLLTILVLAGAMGRSRSPAALGKHDVEV
ncbi:MAG: ABC transporter permease, partial [Candidatus Sumerlaeota bacterium]|nr:ABC transporter permease [Candidatus Sumerlaeota bacterium]